METLRLWAADGFRIMQVISKWAIKSISNEHSLHTFGLAVISFR